MNETLSFKDVLNQESPELEPEKEQPQEQVQEQEPEQEQIQEQEQEQEQEPPKPSRDLSNIPEEDQPYFKAMSNEAFARMKALYEDYGKLKKQYEEIEKSQKELPKAWYEHPQAFVLTENYQKAAQEYNNIAMELNHWEKQYERIVNGQPWIDLEYDSKGNIVPVEKQPDAQSSVKVLGYITETRRQLGELRSHVNQMQEDFKSRHKEVLSRIEQADRQFFPNYADYDNLLKTNKYAETMHRAIDELGQTTNPLSKILVKLYAAYMDIKSKSAKPEIPSRTQPTSKDLAPSKQETNTVSFKDIEPYLT